MSRNLSNKEKEAIRNDWDNFNASIKIPKNFGKKIYTFAKDSSTHLKLRRNEIIRTINDTIGNTITSSFLSNIQTNSVSELELKAFIFYIYKFHGDLYNNGKLDDSGSRIKLWEEIPGLPAPSTSMNLNPKDTKRFYWKLRTAENNSSNRNTYSFSMWHGQPLPVGGRLAVYVSASFGTAVNCGYSYNFKSARLATDISVDTKCSIEVPHTWYTAPCSASPNANVSFRPDGPCGFLDFLANDGALFGTYRLNDTPYFAIAPENTPYQFSAELLVQAIDLNIELNQTQRDLSETKQSIIRVLLSEALEEHKREDNWIVVAQQKLEIVESEDVY